jgi:heme exporter protein B
LTLSTALHKEALLQWRTRARFLAVLAFGAVTLLLFSFAAGPDAGALRRHAPGFLWLALLLSSTLALAESFQAELEQRALEGLLLLPTPARSLFYGKALVNAASLTLLGAALVPLAVVLYDLTLPRPLALLGLLALGAAGLSAPGTLYAAMASQAHARQMLLPLLLFPLVVPVLLSSVKATTLVLTGDPMGQLRSWLVLLACFDAVYWSLCGLLFGRVVEE